MNSGAIGVFDSGVGGLTVLKEIGRLLPMESLIYLGDNRRVPYGQLPMGTIREYALEGLDHLYEQGVKALVIACNTATVAALDAARKRYDVPVIGVIQPTAAAAAERNGAIGVMATTATARSGEYERVIVGAAPDRVVVQQACPLLASFVEAGELAGARVEAVVARYLEPLREARIGTLVLGCTHFPFLRPVIERTIGPDVTIIESGPSVALRLQELMRSGVVERSNGPGLRSLATTGDPASFHRLATLLWPDESLTIEKVDIGVLHERLRLQAA